MLKENIVSRYAGEYLSDKFIKGELVYLRKYLLVVLYIFLINNKLS